MFGFVRVRLAVAACLCLCVCVVAVSVNNQQRDILVIKYRTQWAHGSV